MIARDPAQPHRAASTLELLFDLVFVVAVSRASGSLHHLWEEQHFAEGLISYAMVFFAIWWAWMNFTWFASAYDTDDWLYRITTFVQMGGALTVAAGAVPAMTDHDFGLVIVGYVIMRVAMATQWLRAAASDVERRGTCLRYAAGIIVVQTLWVAWYLLHLPAWLFVVLAALDLVVPVFAERHQRTTYHPSHVAERYGLFTIIVLGESILASSNSIIEGFTDAHARGALTIVAICALTIVASMWWIYFDREQNDQLESLRTSLFWGYTHYFVFASAAAFSAGIEVAVYYAVGKSELSLIVADFTLMIPLAIFLLASWVVLLRPRRDAVLNIGIPVLAVVVVLTSFLPVPLVFGALTMVAAAALVSWRQGVPQE